MKKLMIYVFVFWFVQNTPRVRSLLRTYVYIRGRRFAWTALHWSTIYFESIIDYGRSFGDYLAYVFAFFMTL